MQSHAHTIQNDTPLHRYYDKILFALSEAQVLNDLPYSYRNLRVLHISLTIV